MASIETEWFIGSVVLGAQDFEVDGTPVSVAASTVYLTDPTPALSLLAQVQAAMVEANIGGETAVLLGSGHVRLSAAATFNVVWGGATRLRDLLGFTTDLAGLSAYVAPLKSLIWWSSGKPATFELSPIGARGQKRYIVNQTVAAYTGRAESTSHGTREFQRFSFEKVDAERMMTVDALPGEYGTFYDQVAVRSARCKVYHLAIESPLSTTEFTYESVLGPYLVTLGNTATWDYSRSRGHEWTDFTCDHVINAHVCPEIV
jgi:hypothetical protein